MSDRTATTDRVSMGQWKAIVVVLLGLGISTLTSVALSPTHHVGGTKLGTEIEWDYRAHPMTINVEATQLPGEPIANTAARSKEATDVMTDTFSEK